MDDSPGALEREREAGRDFDPGDLPMATFGDVLFATEAEVATADASVSLRFRSTLTRFMFDGLPRPFEFPFSNSFTLKKKNSQRFYSTICIAIMAINWISFILLFRLRNFVHGLFPSPAGVSQRVEGVVAGVGARRDVGDHDRLRATDERIAQDMRQLALTVRRVTVILIDIANALFKLRKHKSVRYVCTLT